MLISAQRGGKLLIPFSGSGTEIIAGLEYDMEITAFEINKEYYELSLRRIDNFLKRQGEMLLPC
jgi:site-specific DNA-methyltransferase (adenine-specific)